MKDNTPAVHAFTNAIIYTHPGTVLQNATLVIRNGVIESVGTNVDLPADARVWNMEGKTIYPGFIDAYSDVGMKEPRVELDRGNLSWNPQLRAQLTADGEFDSENDGSEPLRSQGFTTALSVPPLGIFKGEAAVMSLGKGSVSDRVVRPGVAQGVSLTRSTEFGFSYPTSAIGAIAFIRQTLYDADWYARAHQVYNDNPAGLQRPESNAALAALEDAVHGNQPLLFETRSDEEILRTIRLKNEFNITPWIRGNGHEYKLLDVLADEEIPLIVPLNFPDTPDVNTPEDALNENLSTLRHWYLAPENPARLEESGIPFSLTADGLENPAQFLGNLREAVHAGLSPQTALAALTTNPASLLGIDAIHGSIESGKTANFIIADGDLFEDEIRILDVWIDGERFRITTENQTDPAGTWEIASADGSIEAILNVEETRPGSFSGAITI